MWRRSVPVVAGSISGHHPRPADRRHVPGRHPVRQAHQGPYESAAQVFYVGGPALHSGKACFAWLGLGHIRVEFHSRRPWRSNTNNEKPRTVGPAGLPQRRSAAAPSEGGDGSSTITTRPTPAARSPAASASARPHGAKAHCANLSHRTHSATTTVDRRIRAISVGRSGSQLAR